MKVNWGWVFLSVLAISISSCVGYTESEKEVTKRLEMQLNHECVEEIEHENTNA